MCYPTVIEVFHALWSFLKFYDFWISILIVCCLLRSNTLPEKLRPWKIIGAGSRASLMWMLALMMLKVLNSFRRVIG